MGWCGGWCEFTQLDQALPASKNIFEELHEACVSRRSQSTPFLAIRKREKTMPKRKNDAPVIGKKTKKRAISDDEAKNNFRKGLFDSKVLEGYTDYYAKSQPYVDELTASVSFPCLINL